MMQPKMHRTRTTTHGGNGGRCTVESRRTRCLISTLRSHFSWQHKAYKCLTTCTTVHTTTRETRCAQASRHVDVPHVVYRYWNMATLGDPVAKARCERGGSDLMLDTYCVRPPRAIGRAVKYYAFRSSATPVAARAVSYVRLFMILL